MHCLFYRDEGDIGDKSRRSALGLPKYNSLTLPLPWWERKPAVVNKL